MDAPPERENILPFINVANILRQAQVNVPEIYRYDVAQGIMLLEDFGNIAVLDRLTETNAGNLYQDALDSLFKLQTNVAPKTVDLPEYDAAFFERELTIFYEWFLTSFLRIDIPEPIKKSLNQCLIGSALEQPVTLVHRDYHSRNLMYLTDDNPGVIDFQDAVIGPITYDLVSLLKDCYIRWPVELVAKWREGYYWRLKEQGLVTCCSSTFLRWFDLMGLQRHLKAIGIFARLHLRDGKSGYLNDIPRTLEYVVEVAENYPELQVFKLFLHAHILPTYHSNSL